MHTENRSSSNPGARTFTLDSLVTALEQVQALHEISADLIAERIFGQPVEQHQGEPVHMVRSHGSFCWEESSGEGLDIALSMPEEYEVRCLYDRPITADAGEVERLRKRILDYKEIVESHADACAEALVRLAERDVLLREQSGKLIVLAARLLQEPLRVLNSDLDSDGPITRIKVTDGVERASDSLGGLALEVRRAANALSAIVSPAVAAPKYPDRLCHIDYQAHPYLCGCLRGDEEAQKIYDAHMRSAKS